MHHSEPLRTSRRHGAALVWIALLLVVFIGFIGLSLDWGYVILVGQQLQTAADAAALAAAQHVKTDQAMARSAAVSIAAANTAAGASVGLDSNEGNAGGGDIVLGRYDRDTGVFNPNVTSPNAVKVAARRTEGHSNGPLSLLFGPMFGFNEADVSRQAIAMQGGGTGAGLITLDPNAPCSLEVSGTVTLQVGGGDIQVNSSDRHAVCGNGNPDLVAEEMNVVGGVRFTGNVTFEGDLNEGADPIPDPLAFLPEPTIAGRTSYPAVSIKSGESRTINAGYYPGGIGMNNGSLTLNPGVYIIGGPGLTVLGGNFTALGVMLFIDQGPFYLGGNGAITITPPDPDEYSYPEAPTYEGVSVFQARDNRSSSTITGTSGLSVDGSLYFPGNHLDLRGNGGQIGSQLIAATLGLSGTGTINIQYEGMALAPGNRSFLVE